LKGMPPSPAPTTAPPDDIIGQRSPGSEPLPDDEDVGNDWIKTYDPATRLPYYYNQISESTTWYKPQLDDPKKVRRDVQSLLGTPEQTPASDPESINSPFVTSAALHPHSNVSSVVPLQHILSEQEKMSVVSTEKITSAIKSQSQAFSSSGETTAALDNLENNPRTAKLFERGLLRPQNVANKQYVLAMEKSLKDREDRLGTLPKLSSRLAKQTPVEYTRTIARPGGVYKYRRPHFTTSPLFS